jgi:hypothetical protein
VTVTGTPKSLHLPIAALDSGRDVYDFQSMEAALIRGVIHNTNTSRRIINKSIPPPIYI